MIFKAEVTGVAQNTYQKEVFTVTAEGRWEGFEVERNISISLSVPREKAREFRLGDGLEIRVLRPLEA